MAKKIVYGGFSVEGLALVGIEISPEIDVVRNINTEIKWTATQSNRGIMKNVIGEFIQCGAEITKELVEENMKSGKITLDNELQMAQLMINIKQLYDMLKDVLDTESDICFIGNQGSLTWAIIDLYIQAVDDIVGHQ